MSAGDTAYYVDTSGGSDDHKGTSAQSAWKSLAKLDGTELKPGDKILLKAGYINRTSGNMKMRMTYASLDWKIPNPRKIIDFHLSGADEKAGFRGRGCSAFNQVFPLAAIRQKYPELTSYRGEEIDKYTAMTFMSNWDEKLNFYGNNWGAKHNNGVPLFMAHLMLGQPYMRSSTIYNWCAGPITTRKPDGSIEHNPVIYQRKSWPFDGGE